MKKLLILPIIFLTACQVTPAEKQARKAFFLQCIDKATSKVVTDSDDQLITNDMEDIIDSCETAAIRLS